MNGNGPTLILRGQIKNTKTMASANTTVALRLLQF